MANIKYILFLFNLILIQFNDASVEQNDVGQVNFDKYVEDFEKEFENYQKTKVKSENFEYLLSLVYFGNDAIVVDEFPNSNNPKVCLACHATVKTFLDLFKTSAKAKEKLMQVAKDLCYISKMPKYICDGDIELSFEHIWFILENKSNLNAAKVCNTIFQAEKCGEILTEAEGNKVLINGAPVTIHKSKISSELSKEAPLKILHLSDIHFDPEYEVGVNAECGIESCCRTFDGLALSTDKTAAGYWGDYRDCDTPWHSIVEVMEQIKREHKNIDLVYFTGDIIHHFTWNTTIENNKKDIQKVYNLLKDTFGDIPVYPILGNHEAHPANLYSPKGVEADVSTQYLYDFISEEWEKWLPDVQSTVKSGGYYTKVIKNGLRIIALNNNVCFTYNRWLMYDTNYFIEELQWLHDTLLEAERVKEKVHILAHIPSHENTCYIGWTREFRKIVERFSDTISGQFNGHSHVDEFNIFYSTKKPHHAINVAWNGGSTTTFINLNPNYKVLFADPKSFEIIDFETWIYNLTDANQHPDRSPVWFKEYSFKEYFNMEDLSPNSLHLLVKSFAMSDSALMKYFTVKQKYSDPLLAVGCDKQCLEDTLCAIVRNEFGDDEVCNTLRNN